MITRTVTRTVARGLFANRSKALPPRTGLLLYLRTPNGTGAAAGKYVATAGSASIFAALGSDWYTDVATPKALTAAEILALASVNDYHILFSAAKGLAIYDPYTTAQADIDRAHAFYRVSIYADDVPTAFFNGIDTTGMTSYTGGPTYAPDHLGVLRSPGAGLPALQGMRLEWVPSGVELSSGNLLEWVNYIATHTANTFTTTNIAGAGVTLGPFTAGKIYKVEVYGSGPVFSGINSADLSAPSARTELKVGFGVVLWTVTATQPYLYLRNSSMGETTVTAISIKELIPTWRDTTITGTPILPSVNQATRTGNTDFTEFIASTTFKNYTRTNPAMDMPGYLCEPARTNKVTCRKANPVDTSGLTKSGDAAAVLSVVDDTAALTAAGLIDVCNTGKVYKLDNSLGVVRADALPLGITANINPHSLLVAARVVSGAGGLLRSSSNTASVNFTNSAFNIIKSENFVPSLTSTTMNVSAEAGAVIHFILPQLEEGAFCTSPICKLANGTDPLTAITRAGTVLSYPTAGKIRSNNIAIRKLIVPRATGQSGVRVYGTYTDANNYTALLMSPTSLTLRKRVAGVDTDATASITHGAGVPLDIIGVRSTTYGMQLAARAYSGGAWGAWINGTAVTTAAAKADAVIASTFQLGALNYANQMAGNISLFDTLLIPEGITDPLAYAKSKWGLPA